MKPNANATPLPPSDELIRRKEQAQAWFKGLRDRICADFEALEDALASGPHADRPPGRFERKAWNRVDDKPEAGGGGVISVMKGRVFEKVGVNISTVFGTFSPDFAKEIPGAVDDPNFFATGISLVSHLQSPLVPAVHMNTRFIVTSRAWFGGGADLTPMKPNPDDTRDFHATMKAACDKFGADYYERFKKWADEYFFLKHRNEPRGVGGIFYDYQDSGDWAHDFAFTQAVGEAFREIYPALVARHMHRPWTEEERAHQLMRRGRYAEFNLIQDRGTRFGLMTGGNTEAILMSLPPVVTWS